ncbi:MAG: polysaccharide biosynthesis tyrosine autokinase [Acidobacteriota bacterium]|nr:MAG: polysaccharide biosynthesis tyrosine autokinase [Acidobacteriota bacterium]
MESNDRLLQIPEIKDRRSERGLQPQPQDYPPAYSPFYDDDSLGDSRSIREYFSIVYKRLPLILAITIIVTAAVAFYMFRQPNEYAATATMIVEPPKPKATDSQSVILNFGYDQNYYNTQLQLMRSQDLMRDVVVAMKLYERESLHGSRQRGILETLGAMVTGGGRQPEQQGALPVIDSREGDTVEQVSLTPEQKQRAEAYAGELSGMLSVEKVETTNLVNLTLRGSEPELIQQVADTLAEMYKVQSTELATKNEKQALADLKDSIIELKKTISDQEVEFIGKLRESNLPVGDGKTTELSASRLGTVSSQLLEAIDARRKLEAEYAAALQAKNPYALSDSSGSLLASQLRETKSERKAKFDEQIRSIDEKIKGAESELAKLRVKYTNEHWRVKEGVSLVESLKRQKTDLEAESKKIIEEESKTLEREVQKEITSALAARLNTARRREAQLSAAYEQEAARANQQGQQETMLTTAKREIENNRGILDRLLQREREMELSIDASAPDNIKVTGNAQANLVGPARSRNILIALFISLVGGIGLTFLLDYLDDSIKSSDDIGRSLGLPTLGLIPHQKTFDKRKQKLLPGNSNGRTASTEFVALEDNRSGMAEAYRHLRTSLLFSSAGKPPETILVTSSQPSEGKTTTAINTAITLAQSGADVVIIDCDLRRPRLHSLFDLENTHGLTNYLSGEKNTENLLKPFPDLPNLKVITSGPIPPNPAELLSSNEMKHLLQFLKGRFQHVVIDSPPAISFTDAAIIATLVDGVVLVAMAGKSSIHLMRRFKHRLLNMGARVYGVVLNGIKPNSVEYSYYGYGYDYSRYYREDESTPRLEEVAGDELGPGWEEEKE